MIMPKEITWWVWAFTALLLMVGVVGFSWGFIAAIVLSIIQTVVFVLKKRSLHGFGVQIRVAYSLLLIVCYIPGMRWLYWLPMVGTFGLILFGYCLTARILSLLPWNRTEKLSTNLLRRTFLSPPVVGNVMQGLPSSGCPGGVCSLEVQVAQFSKR
jgi:hypothetical protein